MKTLIKLNLLACITLFSVACSNSVKLTGNEFLIEGKISGVEDGVVLTLERFENIGVSLIASDTLKNGRFTFRGKTESNPDWLRILLIDDGGAYSDQLHVWAAPRAKIKIRGTDMLIPLWEVKSTVPYQKEQNRYVNNSRYIIAERARISLEVGKVGVKMRAAIATGSEDEVIAYRKIIDSLIYVVDRPFRVKQNYNDIAIMQKADITRIWLTKMISISYTVALNLDAEQTAYFREKAEELYGRMSEDDRNSPNGKLITANLFPSSPSIAGVGDYFADVDLLDVNGNTKRIANYLGKYLLLDFWNRGCIPCIIALPEMREISEIYQDKLTIISISLDTESAWKEAMATHDMLWINLRDPKSWGGLAAAYGVTGIPNYVLISPEGIIVDKWAGYATEYLKQKVSENIGL